MQEVDIQTISPSQGLQTSSPPPPSNQNQNQNHRLEAKPSSNSAGDTGKENGRVAEVERFNLIATELQAQISGSAVHLLSLLSTTIALLHSTINLVERGSNADSQTSLLDSLEKHFPSICQCFLFLDTSNWDDLSVDGFEAKMSAFIQLALHLCCINIGIGSIRLNLVMVLLLGGCVDREVLVNKDAGEVSPEALYKRNSHKWRQSTYFYSRFGCPRCVVILGEKLWFWPHEAEAVRLKTERMLGLRVVVLGAEQVSGELVKYNGTENRFALKVDGGNELKWIDLNEVSFKFIKAKPRYKVCEKEYLRNSEADVGVEVRVYWPQDDTWWQGVIIRWSKQHGHVVRYSDGDEREYSDLVDRKFEIIKTVESDAGEELVDEVHKALGSQKLRHPKFVAASAVESKTEERAANHSFHEEDEMGDEEEEVDHAVEEQQKVDDEVFSLVLHVPAEEQSKGVSWHLLEAVEFLASSGGCDMLCQGLNEAVASRDDVQRRMVLTQLLCLELVMPFLKETYRTELAHVVYSSGVQYLMDLSPEQAIACPLNDFVVIADVISRINLFAELDYSAFCDQDRMGIKSKERRSLVEKFLMNLSAKYVCSNILDKRIFGLETILQGVRNASPSRGIGFGLTSGAVKKKKCIQLTSLDDKDWVVKWMLDNQILEMVYAHDRLHSEIARRGNSLVLLLAHENALNREHLHRLWRIALTAPDESAAIVKSLLLLVIPLLPRQQRCKFFHENVVLKGMQDPPLRFVYKLTMCALTADKDSEKEKENQGLLRKKGSSTEVEEADRSSGEEDEESRIQFYGLYPLWDYVVNEEHSLEHVHTAINYVVHLLDDQHCGSEQHKVVELCIANIKDNKMVPHSLEVLSKLISTLPRHRASWFSRDYKNQETVISALEKNFNLLNLLVEELRQFHGATLDPSPYPYLLQLRNRLDFLLFVLSRTPCRLNKGNVDLLWGLYVRRAQSQEARDLVLAWFGKAHAAGRQPTNGATVDDGKQSPIAGGPVESLDSLTRTALSEEAIRFLFEQRLPQVEVGSASMIGLRVFLSFFIATNVKGKAISLSQSPNEDYNLLSRRNRRKRIKRKAVAKIASTVFASFAAPDLDNDDCDSVISSFLRSSPKLPGEETLWQIALCAASEDVALTAVDTIVHFQLCIHAKVKTKTGRIRSDFIHACMRNITQSTNTDTSQLLKLKQKRAALMLKNLLLSSVSTKASKTITLRVIPPASDQPGSLTRRHWTPLSKTLPERIEVAHDITLSQLHRAVCDAIEFSGDADRLDMRIVNSYDKTAKERDGEANLLGCVFPREVYEKSIDSLGIVDGSTVKLLDIKANDSKPPSKPALYKLVLGYEEEVAKFETLLPTPEEKSTQRMVECVDSEGLGQLHADLLGLLDNGMSPRGDGEEKVIMDAATSRDIWECVSAVPVGSWLKETVYHLNEPMEDIFPPGRLHALIVSLQIVQQLQRQLSPPAVEDWNKAFVAKGGLQHLAGILTHHTLFVGERRAMCMSLLLGVLSSVLETDEETSVDTAQSPSTASEDAGSDVVEPRFRRLGQMLGLSKLRTLKGSEEKTEGRAMEEKASLDLCSMVSTIMELVLYTARPSSGTGLDQVVLHGMRLIERCIAAAGADGLRALYDYGRLDEWTEQLLVLYSDRSTRVATAHSILELCKSGLGDGSTEAPATFFCARLVPLLEKCLQGRINSTVFHRSCDEYFSLLNALVGLLDVRSVPFDMHDLYVQTLDLFQSSLEHTNYIVGFFHLFHTLLIKLPSLIDDPASVQFCCTLYKDMLFPYAFAEKSTRRPKCHTQHTRTVAFALLVRLSANEKNLEATLKCMTAASFSSLGQRARERLGRGWGLHTKNVVDARVAYSGLENKGTTCYMNAFLQQLHKTPGLREDLLAVQPVPCEDEDGNCQSTLRSLQILMESLSFGKKHFVSTGQFCECLRDYDGTKISLTEQKDVSEFGALLFDRLEQENKDTTAVLRRHFGGELINNIVSRDERHEYSSETKEPFYILPLDIKGKKTLTDALDGFVKGEIMTGQNRYQLPSGENVDALKRSGIATFPKHFVFSLKRFEFDHLSMKTRKLNDHFRFPMMVDLTKYKYDQGELDVYEYELTGILAHSGTSDSGHYYSFIRQQSHSVLVDDEKEWYEFNDTMVWPYPEDRIPLDCYGGAARTEKVVNGESRLELTMQNNNAFMLFYERKPLQGVPMQPQPTAPHSNIRQVEEFVNNENLAFEHDNHLFSNDTMGFVWNLAMVVRDMESARTQGRASSVMLNYFISIVIHAAVEPEVLTSWRDFFFQVFHGNAYVAEAALESLVTEELQAAIVESPGSEQRQVVAEVIAFALCQVLERKTATFDSKDACENCICAGRLNRICCRAMKVVFQCAIASVTRTGQSSPADVFWTLSSIAKKSRDVRVVALGHPHLLETVVQYILETLTRAQQTKGKGMKARKEPADLYSVLEVVGLLVRSALPLDEEEGLPSPSQLLPPIPALSKPMRHILMTNVNWLSTIVETSADLASLVLGHLCWSAQLDEDGRKLVTHCIESIEPVGGSSSNCVCYLRVLGKLLTLKDGAEKERCSHFIPKVINRCHNCLKKSDGDAFAFFASRFVLTLAAASEVCRFEIMKQKELWDNWPKLQRKADPTLTQTGRGNLPVDREVIRAHRDPDYLENLEARLLSS